MLLPTLYSTIRPFVSFLNSRLQRAGKWWRGGSSIRWLDTLARYEWAGCLAHHNLWCCKSFSHHSTLLRTDRPTPNRLLESALPTCLKARLPEINSTVHHTSHTSIHPSVHPFPARSTTPSSYHCLLELLSPYHRPACRSYFLLLACLLLLSLFSACIYSLSVSERAVQPGV